MLEEFHITAQQLTEAETNQPYNVCNNIQFFVGILEESKPNLANLRSILSTRELQRADRFAFDLHREVYIISHALLKQQLSKKLRLPIKGINIEYFEDIKPYLRNMPAIDFNLSHSQNYFSFIIGDDDTMLVGVDIEKNRQSFDFQTIVEDYMHPNEKAYILSPTLTNEEKCSRFYEIWTRKEAFLKMHGIGIVTDLPHLNTVNGSNISTVNVPEIITINSNSGTIYSYNTAEFSLSLSINMDKKPVLVKLK